MAFAKSSDMLSHQRRIHRIGMIEILLHPLFKGHTRIVFVVVVLLENDDVRFRQRFNDPGCDRSFAGAGAAANADYQRSRVEWSNRMLLLIPPARLNSNLVSHRVNPIGASKCESNQSTDNGAQECVADYPEILELHFP